MNRLMLTIRRNWKMHAQQANVNIAQKAEREGYTIYSPISGVITQRQVDAGQTVAAGQTLFESWIQVNWKFRPNYQVTCSPH